MKNITKILIINRARQSAQIGFTIVELLIATLVFSVILVVITVGVLHFTSDYYKGINSSTTQNAARNVIDAVSQAIQFGQVDYGCKPVNISPPPACSTPAPGTQGTFCVGSQQFDFILGKEINGPTSSTTDALYQSPHMPGSGCTPITGSFATGIGLSGGKELLGSKMRLAKFSVTPLSDGLYTITVRIVYGDDDLLVSPSGSTPAYTAPDATCSSQTGSQFCATSELSTTVQPRIIGG